MKNPSWRAGGWAANAALLAALLPCCSSDTSEAGAPAAPSPTAPPLVAPPAAPSPAALAAPALPAAALPVPARPAAALPASVLATAALPVGGGVLVGHINARFGSAKKPTPLPEAEPVAMEPEGDRLRLARPGARVGLPRRAGGWAEVADERAGVAVAFRLLGASAAGARGAGGLVVYDEALGPGTALVHRPSAVGTEDFVLLASGAVGALRYQVELGPGVAGLRLVSNTLEFLDAAGAPRLRVAPPYGLRAGGERVAVTLDVEGCSVDRDQRAPWGRAPVEPGSRSCGVRLSWAAQAGPLLIDPAWQTTGSMSDPRGLHTATKMLSGRVLVAGGAVSLNDDAKSTSEIYDPQTGTWAAAAPMTRPRVWHGAWLLKDGRVLVGAGADDTSGQDERFSEIYDPATGAWTLSGALPTARYTQANGYMADGRPFLCGGYSPGPDTFYTEAFAYDEGSGAWNKLPGKMALGRRYAHVVLLPDGRMLLAGGKIYTNGNEQVTDTSELYDPVNGQWLPGPKMKKARQLPAVTAAPDGILFAGGVSSGFPPVLSTVEIYRFAEGDFVEIATMKKPRVGATATWLAQEGRALVAGGADALSSTRTSELVDDAPGATTASGDMTQERGFHTATLLDDGRVLIAGGGQLSLGQLGSPTATAEIFSTQKLGQACSDDGQCPQVDPLDPQSRHCVDGVCCDQACKGACQACTGAKKGSGQDGTCGAVAQGTDPDKDCADEPPQSCGRTGVCDGLGSCERYADGTVCAQACDAGQSTVGQCAAGSCVLSTQPCGLTTCDPSTKACRDRCAGPADCSASAYCDLASETCMPLLDDGEPCPGNAACDSGFCVDGVCCDDACEVPCYACSAALQEPSVEVQDGVCLPAKKAAPDPRGQCANLACLTHDTCDGKGDCLAYVEGESCSAPKCVGNGSIGFRVTAFSCQEGYCDAAGEPASCGNYGCRDGACLAACASDDDCTAKAYCTAQKTCAPRVGLGQPCAQGAQCTSGFCVDGVCCNDACDGPCGTCAAPGQTGRCVPTTGAPPPGRPPCPAASPGLPCQARVCDGIATDTCEGFVGSSVVCSGGACAGDRETSVARCDGKGTCGEAVERVCFPYVCGPVACLTACAADADCAQGNRCEQGACVAGLACDPALGQLRDASGAVVKECGLYRCRVDTGACLTACASSADCTGGAVCGSQGACELPSAPPAAPDAGCGCRASASAPAPAGLLPLLALAAAAALRRPRRP